MKKLTSVWLAAFLLSAPLQAQTQPQPAQPAPQPQPKPRAGTVIEAPGGGKITDQPLNARPVPAPFAPSAHPIVSNDPLAGLKIDRFEAVGNTSVASDTIRVYLGVQPGDPYDPSAIQRNFLSLWQTGLFDDISIEADKSESGGVVVKVTVKERPRIGSVEYRGNKDLATNKITDALDHEKIDIHIGSTIEQTLLRRAAEAIKKAYTENGYEDPQVDPSIVDMGGTGEKKVLFNINEGIKAKVSAIDFTGNAHFSSRRLRSVMKEVKTHNIVTWIRKKDLYIPSKLDEDMEHIKNYYQDYGYFDVAFGEPKVITVGRNTKKPRVRLLIPITEGTVHTFGEVSVAGNTVFTNQEIIGNWPLKKGQIIRRKPIQDRVDAFGEGYRTRGYIYAYVNPEYVNKPGNVIDVKMNVYEGDQFRMGKLEFQGNTVTKDKVLRREIFLEEGSIMDMETFKQSLYKLGQLGYFKVTDNPDFKVNPDSKTVDINVKGNEEGKNDVQFGGGYSEGGGFFLQSQFATRNFLGEGENLSLSMQKGTRVTYYALSYADPWFMDTPNSLGISIFNRNTVYPAAVGYENRGKGGSIAYGYRLHRFDSLSLIYAAERAKIHYEITSAPDSNGNVPVADIADYRYTVSSIAPAYTFDSRDNPYDTTRGGKAGFTLAYSGGPLGGSIHALKPTLNLTKFFRQSKRTTFSMNFEGGRIFPLSKDCSNSRTELEATNKSLCVPETERFLVGGEYSVRGFESYTLGPTQTIGGISQPAGGYKYDVFNMEYIIKINDPLRFVLFADAGQAYAYNEKWDLTKTRFSTGAELRIFLPVFQFPLRFIYAINPRPKTGDRFQSIQFTIGNTY
jgi:outer membrane protein insertion porin family